MPELAASQLGPLTVRGSGFRGREHVRVTVTAAGQMRARTLVADRRGGFVVRFEVAFPRCGSVLVRAVGRQGSRASLELPRPDCREP